MSETDRLRAAFDGAGEATLPVPFFDGAPVAFAADDDVDTDVAVRVAEAFLALGSADRAAAARHVHAYCSEVLDAVGDDDMDEAPPTGPDDVWRLVRPGTLNVCEDDGTVYAMLECECAWEPEHGLLMVWREGRDLVKVGGYDGHVTNVHAFDDETLGDVVYAASEPRFTTRRA